MNISLKLEDSDLVDVFMDASLLECKRCMRERADTDKHAFVLCAFEHLVEDQSYWILQGLVLNELTSMV